MRSAEEVSFKYISKTDYLIAKGTVSVYLTETSNK